MTSTDGNFDGLTNALKRIEELEAEYKWRRAEHENAMEANIALIRRYVWDDGGNNIEADRNAWKARAEALERAANGYCVMCAKSAPMTFCGKETNFVTCEKMRERGVLGGGGRKDCEHWQFNEARFTAIAPEAAE